MPPPDLKTAKKSPDDKTDVDPSERRGFFPKFAAIVIGGLVTLFPLAAGLMVFVDPLVRRQGKARGMLKVTALDSVPDDGVPRAFPIVTDRTDAWTYYPSQPIGAVFLRREKGQKTPVAFQTTCPHAGCRIDYLASDRCFKCPCHNSAFDLSGAIRQPSPSPRPMDQLKCEVRSASGVAEVWVDYQDFYTGVSKQEVKA